MSFPAPLMVDRKCKCCAASFQARAVDVKRGWGLFCSKSCKAVKQERRTGQCSKYFQRQRRREFDGEPEDLSWDAHKSWGAGS